MEQDLTKLTDEELDAIWKEKYSAFLVADAAKKAVASEWLPYAKEKETRRILKERGVK